MPCRALRYHHDTMSLDLPDGLAVDWIEPPFVPAAPDPLRVVRQAIASPIDGRGLDALRGAGTVAIAINDKTRPVPHEILLPPLLDALGALGIPDSAVLLLIATGTHLPMPPEEYDRILPEAIYRRYRVQSHNCDDLENLVALGRTTRGSPILANRAWMEAGARIVIGNIEPHHFAGFSGGAKTAAIGLVGRATINHNHAMLAAPGAEIAEYAANPLRQDIEEIGDALKIDFALNVVMNGEKEIVSAVFGSPRAVMQAGIPLSQPVCQVAPRERFDLVIASVGGAPKDINFYQSQKALTHAALFTRDGGVIVLAAACPEGTGSRAYEEFMQDVDSIEGVYAKFRQQGFRVGPHKAFQVARIVDRVRVILVSEIDPGLVSHLLMTPASTVNEGVRLAFAALSPTPPEQLRIAVLPRATNTILAV